MARTRVEGSSPATIDVGGIAGDRLKSFIERIERMLEEKKAIGEDISEVFAEAKGTGFSPKIMRLIIKERAMDKDDLDEQESLLDLYRRALGMLPLFEAAENAAGKAPATIEQAPAADAAPADPEPPQDTPAGKTKLSLRKRADAEAASPSTATPEEQMEAKLMGEKAGSAGQLHTKNPHALSSPLHMPWVRGWKEGADRYAETGRVGGKVTPIGKKRQAAPLSAQDAATLMSGE